MIWPHIAIPKHCRSAIHAEIRLYFAALFRKPREATIRTINRHYLILVEERSQSKSTTRSLLTLQAATGIHSIAVAPNGDAQSPAAAGRSSDNHYAQITYK